MELYNESGMIGLLPVQKLVTSVLSLVCHPRHASSCHASCVPSKQVWADDSVCARAYSAVQLNHTAYAQSPSGPHCYIHHGRKLHHHHFTIFS